MTVRRVVVTGLGIVSPLGAGHEAVWSNMLASRSGAQRVTDFEVDDIPCQIACRIPLGDTAEGKFNADDWMDVKEQRKVDPFIVFAMAAATQALRDSGYEAKTQDQQERSGVLIGSGIGGIGGIYEASVTLVERGPRRISPFFIPGRLINLASGYVSIEHGLKGPNHSVVTACSTGAHAIGDAARLIMLDDADVMVIGVGGGRDVLSALEFEQSSVTGVEINGDILDILRRAEHFLDGGHALAGLLDAILAHGLVILAHQFDQFARRAIVGNRSAQARVDRDQLEVTEPAELSGVIALIAPSAGPHLAAEQLKLGGAQATGTPAPTCGL
jgi:hypothetical protein